MKLEVMGKFYILKPEKPKPHMGSRMMALMAMAEIMAGTYGRSGSVFNEPKLKDSKGLVTEYILVMQKKSNLSATQRHNVIYLFNKYFEETKENE